MDNKFDINPFDRSALTEYSLLAGRNNEFKQIRFLLRNAYKNKDRIKSILINGERGVGKTSFLNLIENECITSNIVAIRIDLTEANSCNSNEFFWYLFNQTINKVFSLQLFEGVGGPIDVSIQKILNTDGLLDTANWVFKTPILRKNYLQNKNVIFQFHQIIEDLKLVRKEINESSIFDKKNGKLLFLVDESQNIYSKLEIIESLRYIIQSQDLGVAFVFCGDTSYKTSQWEITFGGSYRDFEVISLPYFREAAAIEDYFKKSLKSINWTEKEIEETLFYRFKLACRQIFKLTSGKPAWINTIASKMFERCMEGEVKQLKFDKQAQLNVKRILEDSGELDKIKLDFIDRLPGREKKWLSELFSCEGQSFKDIYFFAKFKMNEDEFITEDQFEQFCKLLLQNGILNLIEKDRETAIGFTNIPKLNFLNQIFYAFDLSNDTIKQWLQISSEGFFRFSLAEPSLKYVQSINSELVTEKFNANIILHVEKGTSSNFRLASIVNLVNDLKFDLNEEPFQFVEWLFKVCKILSDSREKEVLYVELVNHIASKTYAWNVYNYNDKDKIIGYRNSPHTIDKIKRSVEKFNNDKNQFSVNIYIDRIINIDFKLLQNQIIETKDVKKIGIILADKMQDLVRYYITENDLKSSFEITDFFYQLFANGQDLKIGDLNNTAYVFIEKDDLEKAQELLNEAKRKLESKSVLHEDLATALLVYYNCAVIDIKNKRFVNAISEFERVIELIETNEFAEKGTAGALKVIVFEEPIIKIEELKSNNKSENINVKECVQTNIEEIKKYLNSIRISENESA